ncbi:MAG: FtsX-like permease family protein [Oscillospiraceae bacterium]
MFTLLFRKMRNTKWMVLCLLIGFVMASAMMSTIPIYMNASLQRMLVKDMEAFQVDENVYPGIYGVSDQLELGITPDAQRQNVKKVVGDIQSNYDALKLPTENSKVVIADPYLTVTSIAVTDGNAASRIEMSSMTNIADHITISQGRMFKPGADSDGVYECIASERAMKVSRLTLDTVYDIANVFDNNAERTIKIKVVGIFSVSDLNDAYWSEGIDITYVNTLFTDYDTMINDMVNSQTVSVSQVDARYSIDYPNMDMTDLDTVNTKIDEQSVSYVKNGYEFEFPAKDILIDYASRAAQLRLILWLLQIPVMLMIVFYLFMVSRMNVEQERNEIAVFRSRGASAFQIFSIYALETLVLGAATALIGPFVGLGLCQVLGASNGFLEFVNRKALPVGLSLDAFLYSTAAVAVFFITTMLPIIPAAKTTIVEHKQSKARRQKRPLWERVFLDILLVGGSAGWLYYYNKTQNALLDEGMTNTKATINPLLFVASTAFILGAGLFLLRIYPLLVRLIYRIGKRFWSPAQYVSLNNIGRSSSGRERFIMTFLILTVSLGLFFANTARALNRNAEERVSYSVGADVTMTEDWESNSTSGSVSQEQATSMGGSQNLGTDTEEADTTDSSDLQYIEPVFERFEKLAGVQSATKVFTRADVAVQSDDMKVPAKVTSNSNNRWGDDNENSARTLNTASGVRLMTVIPDEFAKVCWSDDTLLPTHINNYLNALAEFNSGVILSSSFQEKYGLKIGDSVNVEWGSNDPVAATVLAFVDYWPSINPYDQNDDGSYVDFAIMNFDYVRVVTAIEPYQIWIDLKDGASVENFYSSIETSGIEPTTLNVASQKIITEKNDPMLQGMNGALTLGFIIIMIMCIIGFLIYWILSIKSRTLQFGILRAMGMSFKEIIAVLLYEQLLVSGVAIVFAVVVGSYASRLFTPLFQSLYDAAQRVPPFRVIPLQSDYLKLYAIIAGMLLIGFTVLGRLISKIKISQALKLGED